jgi:FKBP-type peptidyl-prolyl cis-trans isomerase
VYIVEEGKGNMPKQGRKIRAHYHGTLLTGKKFDSSFERGAPFEFTLGQGQVIKGWDEAFARMKVGTKAVLILPPDLAYGERGAGANIPPNSTLRFDVELLDAE